MGTRANMTNRSKEPRNNPSSTTSGHACADTGVPTGLIHVLDTESELAVLVEEQEHRHRGLDSPSPFQEGGRNPQQHFPGPLQLLSATSTFPTAGQDKQRSNWHCILYYTPVKETKGEETAPSLKHPLRE